MDVDRMNMPAPRSPDVQPSAGLPRGLRDCNPGNLRPGKTKWLGEVEPDGNYCRFDTIDNGIRALAKNLLAYQDVHALCSVRAIIGRWAPPGDNNDTPAYVAAVCDDTGFGADDWLHLHEPSTLAALVDAVIHHENGVRVPMSQIGPNVARALA